MLAVLLVAALSLAPLVAEPRAVAPFDHVVVISVDGLRPDILEGPSLASLPNFARLLRGPHTLNARTDSQHTNTLPNHISMATGRPVHGPYGHCWTGNTDPPSAAAGGTLHINKGAYITSMFDVAGIFDVRAAIDRTTATGTATLVDGTHLAVALASGAVSLPVDIPLAADDAELATCARCGRIDDAPGGAKRARLTLAATPSAETHLGGLTLTHTASGPTRVRWDVIVIDP